MQEIHKQRQKKMQTYTIRKNIYEQATLVERIVMSTFG